MKATIEIEMGEKTCAIEPGKFCKFLGSSSIGQKFHCMLFGEKVFDEGGWLQRCPKCLEELKGE